MRVKITRKGLSIPKEWLGDSKEVTIYRSNKRIVIVPVSEPIAKDDPIWNLGKNPIDDEITDASVNHDRYLYRP